MRKYSEALWGEKDYPRARIDFEEMKIRRELWLHPYNDRLDQYWMPHAPFTLKSHEKKEVLNTLSTLRLPSNYAGPIYRQVQDGRLRYLKSYEFHILLQQVSMVCAHLISFSCRKSRYPLAPPPAKYSALSGSVLADNTETCMGNRGTSAGK
jgi:hypothetical protein